MSLLSLIVVLLLEQLRPLPYRRFVFEPLSHFADILEKLFNAGEDHHGKLAWSIAIGLPIVINAIVLNFLNSVHAVLGVVWSIGVLYLTMGFRQFSHAYTQVQAALQLGDVVSARAILAQWRGKPVGMISSNEVAKLAIEEALAASHRHVFGVLLFFVIFPGPAGAIIYRIAAFFAERWSYAHLREQEIFGRFARQAFAVIDWLPARMTAFFFAIVGNFEDAVECWRSQAASWQGNGYGNTIGIVLASGAGALGIRLGLPVVSQEGVEERVELGLGDEVDVDSMQRAVGLVWRAMLLWLFVLILLVLASLAGSSL